MKCAHLTILGFSLGCAACVGDGEPPEQLPALPNAEAYAHKAPLLSGQCPAGVRERAEWQVVLPRDSGARWEAEAIKVQVDPCGNAVVAFDERGEFHLVRVLGDGRMDWALVLEQWLYLGADGVRDLLIDRRGNIVLATNFWIQAFTPAGEVSPGLPSVGLEFPRLSALRAQGSEWLVFAFGDPGDQSGRAEMVRFSLPSGERSWESKGFEAFNAVQGFGYLGGDDEILVLDDGTFLDAQVYSAGDGSTAVTVVRREERPLDNGQVYTQRPEPYLGGSTLVSFASDGLFQRSQLVREGERTLVGATSVMPREIDTPERCHEVLLRELDDEDWSAEMPFCGYLQELHFAPGGALLSLWAVAEEPYQETSGFRPVLLRHAADGSLSESWELAEQIGRAAQPGVQVFAFKVVEEGAAIIAAGLATDEARTLISRIQLAPSP